MPTSDPSNVLFLTDAFRRSAVMFAAVDLGVFDQLAGESGSGLRLDGAGGAMNVAELARRINANNDALERLLDACVGLGLLNRTDNGFANTPESAAYLVHGSPQALTGYIDYSKRALWWLWGNLTSAVREGTPRWKQAFGHSGGIFDSFYATEEAKREFLLGMHGYGLLSSPATAAAVDLSGFAHLVDLGGGTGHFAITACRMYPNLRATVFDLPAALPMANEQIEAAGMSGRISTQAGNFFTDSLPPADLYSLGRIVHDWSEEKIRTLLRKTYDALPAHGAVLILEKMLTPDRNGPMRALLQSLNMLVATEGKERTLDEYRALLHDAGFTNIQGATADTLLDAILALKS